MGNQRTTITIDAAGNFVSRLQGFGRQFGQFSEQGRRHLGQLQRTAQLVGGALDRMGNRWTALATGAAGVGTVRSVVALDARLTRLQVQAEITGDEMRSLKDRIFEVAQAPDIRVDPSEIVEAIEEIVARTGRLDLAVDNIENLGRTIQATGAAGRDAGGLVANIFEKFRIDKAEEILQALDTLTRQGKAGAFELKDLATQGNELMAAFASTGRVGPEAVREMGAIIQMIRRATGSSAEATTSFERLMSALTEQQVGELRKRGIRIWDEEALENGQKMARSVPDIIRDIITATRGDTEKLAEVFDIRALRALRAFALEFQAGHGFEAMESFLAIQGDGAAIMADAATNAATAAAAMQNLRTAWQSFANEQLTEPIQRLADIINDIDPERLRRILSVATATVAALAAVSVGMKIGRGVMSAARFIRGPGAGGGAGGVLGGRASAALAQPVYVTNWPGALGGPGGGAAAGAGAGAGAAAGRGMGLLAKTGLVAGAGALGFGAGTLIDRALLQQSEQGLAWRDRLGEAVATALAQAGVGSAREALEANERARMSGELVVRIETDAGDAGRPRARVRRLRTRNLDVDVDTSTGVMMTAP